MHRTGISSVFLRFTETNARFSLNNMKLLHLNPNRLTPRNLLLGAPIYLLILKGFIFPLPLLDFWWHLKMGQLILSSGTIPRTDLFSFTAAGKTFVVQNWLSEIILFLTYKLGHFPLLIFFNTLLLVASLIPIYYLCRKSSSRFWPPSSLSPSYWSYFRRLRPSCPAWSLISKDSRGQGFQDSSEKKNKL